MERQNPIPREWRQERRSGLVHDAVSKRALTLYGSNMCLKWTIYHWRRCGCQSKEVRRKAYGISC